MVLQPREDTGLSKGISQPCLKKGRHRTNRDKYPMHGLTKGDGKVLGRNAVKKTNTVPAARVSRIKIAAGKRVSLQEDCLSHVTHSSGTTSGQDPGLRIP